MNFFPDVIHAARAQSTEARKIWDEIEAMEMAEVEARERTKANDPVHQAKLAKRQKLRSQEEIIKWLFWLVGVPFLLFWFFGNGNALEAAAIAIGIPVVLIASALFLYSPMIIGDLIRWLFRKK